MTKSYELVVLLNPEYTEQDVQAAQEKISSFVKKLKGTVDSVDSWGKKTLAYAINKHTEAWYILFNVTVDTEKVADLNREISLQTEIIRHLLVIQEAKSEKPVTIQNTNSPE